MEISEDPVAFLLILWYSTVKQQGRFISELVNILELPSLISPFSSFSFFCQRYRWVSGTRTPQSIPWIQDRQPWKYTVSGPGSWHKSEHTPAHVLLLSHSFVPSKTEANKSQPTKPKQKPQTHTNKHPKAISDKQKGCK